MHITKKTDESITMELDLEELAGMIKDAQMALPNRTLVKVMFSRGDFEQTMIGASRDHEEFSHALLARLREINSDVSA